MMDLARQGGSWRILVLLFSCVGGVGDDNDMTSTLGHKRSFTGYSNALA